MSEGTFYEVKSMSHKEPYAVSKANGTCRESRPDADRPRRLHSLTTDDLCNNWDRLRGFLIRVICFYMLIYVVLKRV